MTITFEHVTYRYTRDDTPALRDLTLELDTASLIGVCGRAGSGKSTLIQHLNGILTPTSGRILIDGEDLHATKQARQRARQRIGMSFQFPERQLFGRTVWEELTYTLAHHQVPPHEQERRVTEVCDWLGFDVAGQRDRSPFALSRSQQRTVGIAVVLALQPDLVVLDEPTAGLDRVRAVRLLDTLQRLHHQGRCRVLLVSHDLELLLEYADEVVVLSAGTVGWQGAPRTILASPDLLEPFGLALPEAYRHVGDVFARYLADVPPSERTLHRLLRRLAPDFPAAG